MSTLHKSGFSPTRNIEVCISHGRDMPKILSSVFSQQIQAYLITRSPTVLTIVVVVVGFLVFACRLVPVTLLRTGPTESDVFPCSLILDCANRFSGARMYVSRREGPAYSVRSLNITVG